MRDVMERAEHEQPWVIFRYGMSHDLFWPPWSSTRVTGKMKIELECVICGHIELKVLSIPRFGRLPEPAANGRHPARVEFLIEHVHEDLYRWTALQWRKPLKNANAPAVFRRAADDEGAGLRALKQRWENDLRCAAH